MTFFLDTLRGGKDWKFESSHILYKLIYIEGITQGFDWSIPWCYHRLGHVEFSLKGSFTRSIPKGLN